MKPLILLILLAVTDIACADTIPYGGLVWSDSPVVTFSDRTTPTAIATSTGLSIDANNMSSAVGAGEGYTVTRDFAVTAPGDFLLSTSVIYSLVGTTCSPAGCTEATGPSFDFTGGFSGSVDILNLDDIVFSQGFEGSGSSSGICVVYIGTDGPECSAGAILGASDQQSDMVDLAIGDYTLEVNYVDGNNSPGDSYTGPLLDSNLVGNTVTTPEPRELGLLIAVIAVMILAKACSHASSA